ncbi:precorrin-6y C5,15-methyltransferase (decarboxylating) subunit CbiE [Streptomyces sp. NPDC050610]|uniref:precorrin-6y C5,15-methyltransferase (decarboxylating) subunit CbiE n=1 Tax=Streptomyces sp. NPDC050610 TaxID=3157097 RepID=UPI0034470A1A
MTPVPPPPPETTPGAAPVTVVGIGADGWPGLAPASQETLRAADVLIGGPRQLGLLPPGECAGERVAWPSPLRPAVPGLIERFAGRRVSVLASGDPMFFGIGRTLTEVLGPERLRVLPHPSSISYACARLGWAVEETEVISLVGRPAATLSAAAYAGRRLLVLSAGADTPAEVAALLCERGFGPSRLRVLARLGGADEHIAEGVAEDWPHPPGDALNVVAVDCRASGDAVRLALTPGLPDHSYEHDGQLTKRHVRAATFAALAPAPGELLWDVGGGAGSIGIEWMRAHRSCRAVSIERDPVRARRIERNASALGVPGLRVVTGPAPDSLAELPTPDAVFIGGGLTAPGVLDACWDALRPGGRIVANTVTLESEALLADRHRRLGGELVRIAVAHAVPVGGFTGWRQAMPVTQWAAVKPGPAAPAVGSADADRADVESADVEIASADSADSADRGEER